MKTGVFMICKLLLLFSRWKDYMNKKNDYKRNVTAELSLSLTLYVGFLFQVIFHLGRLAPNLQFQYILPPEAKLVKTWTLIIIVIPEQTRSIARVWSHLLPQANLFKTLTSLIFAIRADMFNAESLITFATPCKLFQD